MRKEEFYFDSRDGKSKIHAVKYLPEEKPVCIFQIIHGMSEYVERYEEFAEFLTGKGCLVTGEDHLGHGKSVDEGGTYGYFCEQDPATVVVRDAHRLKKITQQAYPDIPYVILGHSMGSFILRNYICRYGTGITAAVIMGTGMQSPGLVKAAKAVAAVQKVFCGPMHTARLLDRMAFGRYNEKFSSENHSGSWLSRDALRTVKYAEDSRCGFTFTVNGFQTLFELISRVQKRENLEKMPKELPILMVSGMDDPVGEYGRGVKRALESLKEAGMKNVELKLYEKDRHELLNELDRDVIMQDIWNWVQRAAGITGEQRR